MLSHISKIIIVCFAMLVSGCLINEPFVRTYNIDISASNISTEEVESFFAEYFLSKGLLLKRKYSVLYPAKSHYMIYEIRSRNENNAYGYPSITLFISEPDKVYLQQEEWTVQPTQPTPSDYIAELRNDLERRWNKTHKKTMRIEIIDTIDPYRGFSHDN